jgi:hypothetical protein
VPWSATIDAAAAELEAAAGETATLLQLRQVQGEDDFTSRLLSQMEARINGRNILGVQWRAMKLTDRGSGSQERHYGADFAGVLAVDVDRTKFAKGFLGQAKLLRRGSALRLHDLRAQCERMLNHTADSFVFLYGDTGVRVVSALLVASSDHHPRTLPSWNIEEFFRAHFMSFVGDRRIDAASPDALEAITDYRPRHLLRLEAHQPIGSAVPRLA